MKWNIIGDSGCDLLTLEENTDIITYKSVPFYITIEGKEYSDTETLDIPEMMKAMKSSKNASSTACPSPQAWLDKMDANDNNICVTVSKNLSGSYASGEVAAETLKEEYPDAKAAVVDGCATGPASVLAVRKMTELIKTGENFEAVVEKTREYISGINTVFALSCFDNLVKSGRVSKIAGLLAASLNFWGIGFEDGGRIAMHTKVRGKKKAVNAMLELIKENGFNSDEVVISHCMNEELALEMKGRIEEINPDVKVTIFPARGLNSYYADKEGIIISY